jgi:hypothetical protein
MVLPKDLRGRSLVRCSEHVKGRAETGSQPRARSHSSFRTRTRLPASKKPTAAARRAASRLELDHDFSGNPLPLHWVYLNMLRELA